MDSAKVKSFVIALLLITNVFLFSIVAMDRMEAGAYESLTSERLAAVIDRNGIILHEGVALPPGMDKGYTMSRDMDGEKRMMETVLGSTEVIDQGGNITVYLGEKGEARLSGSGEIFVVLAGGAVSSEADDRAEVAAEIAAIMGIETIGEAVVRSSSELETVLTLRCAAEGAEVINRELEFTFSADSLKIITGQRVPGISPREGQGGTADMATVLVGLLEAAKKADVVCGEIIAMELCYKASDSVSGTGELSPFIKIITDAGNFFSDCKTGKTEMQ